MRNEVFEVNETVLIKLWENSTTQCFANQSVILREQVSQWVSDWVNRKPIWRQGWIVELPDGKMAGVRVIRERKE